MRSKKQQSGAEVMRMVAMVLLACAASLVSSCSSTGEAPLSPTDQIISDQRAMAIAAEEPGDYWIGRRWWTKGTRFWGYVRRPRQQWQDSRLVMMYEGYKHTPDRLAEDPLEAPGRVHGFDHNYEYRLQGNFSGAKIYDPNSDLILPEFVLRDYQLLNPSPGFLFRPDERYLPTAFPPKYPRTGG